MLILEQIEELEATGAGYAHIDIMDGHLAQYQLGAGVVAEYASSQQASLWRHLMVSILNIISKNSLVPVQDIISIHAEATPHIHGHCKKIRATGVKPSVVINPGTPVEAVKMF